MVQCKADEPVSASHTVNCGIAAAPSEVISKPAPAARIKYFFQRVAVAILAVALIPVSSRAEPAIVAKLDLKYEKTVMAGELNFDLGGGKLQGHAELSVDTDPADPPTRKDGTKAPGRFQVRIDLDGDYAGGSFGAIKGSAKMSGTFTDDKGRQTRLAAPAPSRAA